MIIIDEVNFDMSYGFYGVSLNLKHKQTNRDGNFYPIRRYPARPDPNGPGFTRSV